MFLHWLGPVNADRTQFLDEAVALAGHGPGLVSLLPQEVFPFAYGPIGDVRDRDQVINQVVQLRRGLDLLHQLPQVRDDRVAVVGHDYGGMYATILGAVDRDRIRSEVVIAADTTWANWFITFFLSLPPDETGPYAAMLSSLDPINYISHGPRGGILLQYATDDFFIPNSVARQMARQAHPRSTFRTYPGDHELTLPSVRTDRDAFLATTLQLSPAA
jgi:pimeloyl-ACP methyl ester carboxylesterase